ncbi:MAG: MBL fold metallo-hydrolase [Bacteroidota bacterium]
MQYNITAYSTALFSTWINIEQLGILFDAGDGVSAGLLQKSRKIKQVFITHPDRDHLTGLLQFNQLNARGDGFPKIYYPKDSGSFPAFEAFQGKFDPHVQNSVWKGIQHADEILINKQLLVQAIRNNHIVAPAGVAKSLSYKIFDIKRKVKPEFAQLSGEEIKQIAISKGKDFLTEEVRRNVFSYSGDTPVDDFSRWDQSDILIHESTFLDGDADLEIKTKKNAHSRIDEVFKMVSEIKVGQLVLSHFSSRYSREMIDQAIRRLCKAYQIQIPVYAIYPGEIHRDILSQEPLNA